jgi:multidrug efflux pump subunit AcrA (membrane-fusion protein)
LVLLVVAAIVAYIKFMSGTTAKVATVVATPREVVRLYDATATVRKSEGQTLSFGEAGKVSDVVAAGTEAKAGMPLATLESFAKIEKELADVKDRASFYEKQLATAKAKGDAAATAAAEGKVAEKKKLTAELEARAAKVRLIAPGTGSVVQVMAQAGSDIKPGDPVLKLADKHAIADFKLGGDAAALKAGEVASLQPALGGAPLSARVAKVVDGTVTVELPEDTTVKAGDAVRLVKQRVPNVVPVPATAVAHRETGDVVYVLADGTVHQRNVNVVDRDGSEALIGSGLTGGDIVVSAGADNLHDGQKATQ